MTTTTTRAADLHLGADQAITLRLDHAAGAELAKADPDLITGVAVVKPGTFNGSFVVEESDLHAWAERFDQLRGVFRPPLREDHSWTVSQVLGRFEELRVEARPDDTIGGADVPMLVGDIRLVGTAQEKADTRDRILSGKYDERSSEFYPYRTNAGVEYPSVFMGAAFVDIPAVEGLGGITLRRATLSTDRTDITEGADVPDELDDEQTPAPDAEAPVDEQTPAAGDGTTPDEQSAAPVEPAADAPVMGDDPADDDADDDADDADDEGDDQPTGEVPPTGDLRAAARAAGVTDEVLLRRLEHEVERRANLRVEHAARMTELTGRGVIAVGVRPHVEALLAHTDQAVRDGVYAILSAARPPVALRGATGTRTSVAPGGARDGDVIHLTMTPEEVDHAYAEAYDAATTDDQRRHLRAELSAWQSARVTQQ